MEPKDIAKLELPEDVMRQYGHSIVDMIVDHNLNQHKKLPVAQATRSEMDSVFLEEAPEKGTEVMQVLDFVMQQVVPYSNIMSHPKFYSFVPGPSNYVSAMADALATGFNIFSGGWAAAPAAAELEIVTINWLLKIFGLPAKRGGGIFTSGGSMANLTALVTARSIKCGEDFSKAVI